MILTPGPAIAKGSSKICYAYGDNEVILAGEAGNLAFELERLYELASKGLPVMSAEACQFRHENGEIEDGIRAPRYRRHILLWHTRNPRVYLDNGVDQHTLTLLTDAQYMAVGRLMSDIRALQIDIGDPQLLIGGPPGEPDVVLCDPDRIIYNTMISEAADCLLTFLKAKQLLRGPEAATVAMP